MKSLTEHRIENSKKGELTLIVSKDGRDYPVHSRISPLREKDAFIKRFDPSKYDFLVILGCGLGYHLIPLKEIAGLYNRIIIVDYVKDVPSLIEKNPHTNFLLSCENVMFITGEDSNTAVTRISGLIDFEKIRGVDILGHPASLRIFSEYYEEINKKTGNLLNRKAGSTIAKNTFGVRYLTNALKNLRFHDSFCSLNDIVGRFKDRDVLIVSSGPTVYSLLPRIRKKRNSFYIIAVDSAIGILRSAELDPDFIVSIDPQPYILEHFQGADISGALPVFSLTAYSGAVEYCIKKMHPAKRGIFLSLNSHPVSQVIEGLYPGMHGTIDSNTGSVAGDAVRLALILGFRRIFLMGMDFSFPDYCIYSRGSAYQRRYSRFFQTRILPVETSNMNYIVKSSKALRFRGSYTRSSFLQYRESLEELLLSEERAEFFNVKEDGLGFEKIVNVSFDDAFPESGRGNLDRISYLDEIMAESGCSEKEFSISGISDTLLKEGVFEEFMKVALGEGFRDSIEKKIRFMIEELKNFNNQAVNGRKL